MRLDEMTWPEVKALDPAGAVAVVPFAAVEQHGPHLPIGTDSFITQAVGERLEGKMPRDVVLVPVQRFGSSPHHMVFPGTVTLGSRAFLDVARELVESLAAHGLRRFLLLNGHGGNQALLNVAVQEIRLRMRELRVVHATYWVTAAEAFAAIRESAEGGMGHACEMETSIILAIRPELVRRDRIARGGAPPRGRFDHRDMLRPAPVGQFRFWNEMSENGVLGDPTLASAEKGERFLDAAAAALADLVRDLLQDRIG